MTALGVGLVLAWATPAAAGPPTDQLRASLERILRILEDPALGGEPRAKERKAAIRREADQVFDFEETARRALGRHWQPLSEGDRREFVGLFADLLERSYISRIEQYSGEKIAYAGDTAEGDLATVRTRFTTRQSTEIPIDYRMHRRGDRWLVYDVVVEGVSLVANYRSQFNKIIQTTSYQDLVARMKKAEFSAPGASSGTPGGRVPRS